MEATTPHPPSSGPAILIAGLQALGHASPAEIAEWYTVTFDKPLPVTDATLRQAATRLARDGRVVSVEDEHGVYSLPSPGEERVPYDAAVPRSRAHAGSVAETGSHYDNLPSAGSYAPHLTVTALYDNQGRHFADRVVAVVQRFTPYAAEVSPDGVEHPISSTR